MPFSTEKLLRKAWFPLLLWPLVCKANKHWINKILEPSLIIGHLRKNSARFDLFNAQFVQNLNPQNYFNVYGSSYELEWSEKNNTEPSYFNDDTDLIIETGTSGFINEVLSPTSGLTLSTKCCCQKYWRKKVKIDRERFYSSDQLHVYKTTKTDLLDNTFYLFKTKLNLRDRYSFYFEYNKSSPK
jgi:hypothetical protein